MTDGNDLAYPIQDTDEQGRLCSPKLGLTKREYFAALALQGILASRELQECLYRDAALSNVSGSQVLVNEAVEQADALITELNKTA